MTGDQVFSLLKMVLVLLFAAFVLYGVYRIATRNHNPQRKDGAD